MYGCEEAILGTPHTASRNGKHILTERDYISTGIMLPFSR